MNKVTLKTFLHPRYWYAWPALGFMLLMSWMPSRLLWLLGSGIGWFFSLFPSKVFRFAVRNLELCFPDLDPAERRRLVRCHFRLCGFAFVSLSVAWFAPKWRIRRFITLRGWEHVEAAYANNKNVVLLAPHFIGLDIGAMRASFERNFVSMYRRSRNPLIEYLFQRRGRYGGVVIERNDSIKPVIRIMRDGWPFYYLPDQDMGERASVFAPFFGIQAATVTALGRIAQMTNAVVVPCITRLLPAGKGIEVRLFPAMDKYPTENAEADARRMNKEIEQWVREMPEQYMWTYRRFKTRPNGEPSLYAK